MASASVVIGTVCWFLLETAKTIIFGEVIAMVRPWTKASHAHSSESREKHVTPLGRQTVLLGVIQTSSCASYIAALSRTIDPVDPHLPLFFLPIFLALGTFLVVAMFLMVFGVLSDIENGQGDFYRVRVVMWTFLSALASIFFLMVSTINKPVWLAGVAGMGMTGLLFFHVVFGFAFFESMWERKLLRIGSYMIMSLCLLPIAYALTH